MAEVSGSVQEELEAWKEVHRNLTAAVLAAREGVAAAKAQRRFWLEEICGNLTPEGKLVSTSVWKRAAATKASRKAPKKSAAKAGANKRAKKNEDGATKPKKTKGKRKKKAATDDEQDGADNAETDAPPLKKAKIRLSLKKAGSKPKKAATPKRSKKRKTADSEDDDDETASPSTEQEGSSYADWTATQNSTMPPPQPQLSAGGESAAFGITQGSSSLSAADHFAMMQNVPAELLPFLSPQPGGLGTTALSTETPTAASPPSSQGAASYPNAYASLAQGSSDDDSSMEE